MKRKRPTTPKRQSRRTPDARALEWAEKRLEKAVDEHTRLTERIRGLDVEIPRLAMIIAALGPLPEQSKPFPAGSTVVLRDHRPADIRLPRKVVAGMDVSRFVNQRPPTAEVSSDDDDALLAAADAALPKGNTVLE